MAMLRPGILKSLRLSRFKWLFALPLLLAATGGLWYGLCPRPDLRAHTDYSSAFYDRHGELLRLTLAADQRFRLWLPLQAIAPAMIEASLLYEDRYFYQHAGVNIGALLRAFFETYIKRSRRIGASTISMQLARLRFDLNTRSLWGKLVQIARALQIERHYSKDAILEAYLNLAPYGLNIEGVGAASLIYFHKPAAELSLQETLALSVIPQHPEKRNPTKPQGYAELNRARKRLFTDWLQRHPQDRERLAQLDLPLKVHAPAALPFKAPHFVDALLQADPHRPAGNHRTSLDLALQSLLERHVQNYLARQQKYGVNNAAAILLDYRQMTILAEIGSADFFDSRIFGQVNGARAARSPGSALKPFIYALALDRGLIHPMSLMKDAPQRFGAYTPENYDQQFLGPVFAREAYKM